MAPADAVTRRRGN